MILKSYYAIQFLLPRILKKKKEHTRFPTSLIYFPLKINFRRSYTQALSGKISHLRISIMSCKKGINTFSALFQRAIERLEREKKIDERLFGGKNVVYK